MVHSMKRVQTILVLGMLLSLLIGGQACAAPSGTLYAALGEEPDFLDPHRTTRFHSLVALSYIAEPLLDMDKNLEPVPLLAESIDWSDDKLTMVVYLKEGILFHNGQEMTSEDVKASYERYFRLSPLEDYLGPDHDGIYEIEIPDRYTVVFRFRQPKPLALTYMADAHASILPAEWLARTPDEEIGVKGLVGTGPFAFSRWVRGDRIELKRHESYDHAPDYLSTRGPAPVETLVMRIIPEDATMLAEILAGNVDYTFDVPAAGYAQIEAMPGLQVRSAPSYSIQYMALNMQRDVFVDRRVRLAIAHAINKDEIVMGAWFGQALPLHGLVGPGTTGYWKGVEAIAYAYDPERAAEYLDAAGWELDTRRNVRVKDGRPLELQLISFSNLDQWRRAAEVVQATLAKLGIKVNLELAEVGATYDRAEVGDYDGGIFRNSWWMGEPYLTFLTRSNNIGSSNFGQWENEAIDTLLGLSVNSLDDELRRDAFNAAQAIVVESGVWIPLAVSMNAMGGKADLQGIDELFSHPWQPPLMRALLLYRD